MFDRYWSVVAIAIGMSVAPLSLSAAQVADGQLDPTFGVGGKVTIHASSDSIDHVSGLTIQPDGKILVLGQPTLARFNANGTLDTTFATGGKFDLRSNHLETIRALAVQQDGKILLGADNGRLQPHPFLLVRLNPDGSFDGSFGADGTGMVTTDFGVSSQIFAVRVRDDGKIVAVGRAGDIAGIARYLANGAPDTTFAGVGFTMTRFGAVGTFDGAATLAIQPDGKVIAAGFSESFGIALARYLDDGSLDPSFGGDGRVTTDVPTNFEQISSIAIQPDGAIVAVVPAGSLPEEFIVVRYRADGSLDPSFGSGGLVTPLAGLAEDVALQPDGKILVAGTTLTSSGDYVVIRLLPDGSIDPTYGTNGVAAVDFNGMSDQVSKMAIDASGRVVLAGIEVESVSPAQVHWGLARLRPPVASHALTFFPTHDPQTPGTATTTFLMTPTAPSPQTATVVLSASPTWASSVPLSGLFQANATFVLRLPCTPSLNSTPALSVQVAAVNASGSARPLAATTVPGTCSGSLTIAIPASRSLPVTLSNEKLRLTLSGGTPRAVLELRFGSDTFVESTNFFGTT